MIIAVIAEKQDAKDICDMIFTATKEKYVRLNFRDLKHKIMNIFGDLRLSSKMKYRPFTEFASLIEQSNKIVLVDDCNTEERIAHMRKHKTKFIHFCSSRFFEEGDLYIEKIPKTVREMTSFLDHLDVYMKNNGNVLFQGDGWVLTEG